MKQTNIIGATTNNNAGGINPVSVGKILFRPLLLLFGFLRRFFLCLVEILLLFLSLLLCPLSLFASVFDGHGGAKAMLFLKKHFLSAFEAIAEEIFEDSRSSLDTVDVIKRATSLAFAEADVAFETEALECVLKGQWGAAQVGACVLMACTTDSNIVVANAGDCRALLAVRDETSNKLRPCQISNDHNAREKVEKIKLRNTHPDESNVIVEYVVRRSQSHTHTNNSFAIT